MLPAWDVSDLPASHGGSARLPADHPGPTWWIRGCLPLLGGDQGLRHLQELHRGGHCGSIGLAGSDRFSRRGASAAAPARMLVLEVLTRAQELLDEGLSKSAVADELGVLRETLRRAVWDGRLHEREEGQADASGSDSARQTERQTTPKQE